MIRSVGSLVDSKTLISNWTMSDHQWEFLTELWDTLTFLTPSCATAVEAMYCSKGKNISVFRHWWLKQFHHHFVRLTLLLEEGGLSRWLAFSALSLIQKLSFLIGKWVTISKNFLWSLTIITELWDIRTFLYSTLVKDTSEKMSMDNCWATRVVSFSLHDGVWVTFNSHECEKIAPLINF